MMKEVSWSSERLQSLVNEWYDASLKNIPLEECSSLYAHTDEAIQFLYQVSGTHKCYMLCQTIIGACDRHSIDETAFFAKWSSKIQPANYCPSLHHLLEAAFQHSILSLLFPSRSFAHLECIPLREEQMRKLSEEQMRKLREEQMRKLSVDINAKQKSLSKLVKTLSDDDWALLGPHLNFVDLRNVKDSSKIELILKACTHITHLDIRGNESITELPSLPYCEYLDCSGCSNLTKLNELPFCKCLECNYCPLTVLPALPSCKKLYCEGFSNLQNFLELYPQVRIFNNQLRELKMELLEKLEWRQGPLVSDEDFKKTQNSLKDWIEQADEKSLRLFLFTVTYHPILPPENIGIWARTYTTKNLLPVAHGNLGVLELSVYLSKEELNQKLEILLTETRADKFFQIAMSKLMAPQDRKNWLKC